MITAHTLTYNAHVDPPPGTILGPGLDGNLWEVTGTVHTPDGKSWVDVERVAYEESPTGVPA